MILNTPQNSQGLPQEVQAEGFAMAITAPRPRHRPKSVDRPQQSSAVKRAEEPHRTSQNQKPFGRKNG